MKGNPEIQEYFLSTEVTSFTAGSNQQNAANDPNKLEGIITLLR